MAANDQNGVSWNVSSPADGDYVSVGAQEIRGLRKGVEIRLNREHSDCATGSVGGEHVAGSAFPYLASTAPTTRPDGVALTSADYGRLWLDTTSFAVVKYYSAGGWLPVRPGTGVISAATMFADDVVTGAKIAHATIVAENLASNSVETAKIKDLNVTTEKINDLGVTAAKLAADAVETAKIKDAAVTAAKLASGVVPTVIKVGTYSGSTGNVKVTFTFQPTYVYIWKTSGTAYHGNSVASATSLYKESSGAVLTTAITYDTDGFTITSTSADVNGSGSTFHYYALKG